MTSYLAEASLKPPNGAADDRLRDVVRQTDGDHLVGITATGEVYMLTSGGDVPVTAEGINFAAEGADAAVRDALTKAKISATVDLTSISGYSGLRIRLADATAAWALIDLVVDNLPRGERAALRLHDVLQARGFSYPGSVHGAIEWVADLKLTLLEARTVWRALGQAGDLGVPDTGRELYTIADRLGEGLAQALGGEFSVSARPGRRDCAHCEEHELVVEMFTVPQAEQLAALLEGLPLADAEPEQ
ncbi:hypothetical protein AB0C77_25230 [Streptomyces sp. NPDC048629]|uniref:hypothetical protein n=1 Tax=Streptomyces sp. NPDC048629 TaxID=3154824 RepID=UPI00342ACF58